MTNLNGHEASNTISIEGVPPKDVQRVRKGIFRTLAPHSSETMRQMTTSTEEAIFGLSVSQLAAHVRPYSADWKLVLEDMQQRGEVEYHNKVVNRRTKHTYTLSAAALEAFQQNPDATISEGLKEVVAA